MNGLFIIGEKFQNSLDCCKDCRYHKITRNSNFVISFVKWSFIYSTIQILLCGLFYVLIIYLLLFYWDSLMMQFRLSLHSLWGPGWSQIRNDALASACQGGRLQACNTAGFSVILEYFHLTQVLFKWKQKMWRSLK